MRRDQIEAYTNAANTSAVWKYLKRSKKDAKMITSLKHDSERLLVFRLPVFSASHVSEVKRKSDCVCLLYDK